MKKGSCINSEISYEIAKMGHYDQITIADAGLPIPNDVKRIDLAVTYDIPSFKDVFNIVMSDLKIQRAYIACETKTDNPDLYDYLCSEIKKVGAEMVEVPHTELKKMIKENKAVIRTGECKPFSNIILESTVVF
jgi:D-ribose pyranase